MENLIILAAGASQDTMVGEGLQQPFVGHEGPVGGLTDGGEHAGDGWGVPLLKRLRQVETRAQRVGHQGRWWPLLIILV